MTVKNKLCILVLFIEYGCFVVYGRFHRTGLYYISKCDDEGELYLLGEQTVQVTRSASLLVVSMCVDATRAPTTGLHLESLLHNVTELQLWDIAAWPPLPENSHIEHIDMSDVLPAGAFGRCSNLTSLRIASSPTNFTAPSDWLANCSQLGDLYLAHFAAARARALIDTVPNLRTLTLDAIPDWPTVIRNPIFPTPRGREQSISKVWLTDIFYRYKWNDHLAAKRLNTTWAEVSAAMVEQLSLLSRLEELSISNIMYFDLCPKGNITPVVFRSLRMLTVSVTNTVRVCFAHLRTAPLMTKLAIGHPLGTDTVEILFKELFPAAARAPQLFVEADHGNTEWIKVQGFNLDKEDYYALSNGTKKGNVTLTLFRESVECDCQNAWLARALREGLLTAPGVVCSDSRQPHVQLPEWLECDKVSCIAGCECRRDWRRNVLVADCSEASFTTLPAELLQWSNLTDLLLPRNRILKLPEDLPKNIQLLDLSDNAIWQLGAQELAALFEVKTRRVRLSGNPIVCTCDNRLMIDTLRIHRQQVEDYDRILCVGDNTKLEKADVNVLCASRDLEAAIAAKREADLTIAVTVTVALATIALIVAVAFYYRRAIRIFLFARGWCLSCLREDDLDADCRYEVFLSYCHEDHELVHSKILPVLDKEYSVCVHTRDWCPGEMIPTQIMWSVESSRRTVVIMSRSFVKSLWGVLEFRTAYASGLSAGRVRVVMVVLDNVLESPDLHGELKAYVRLNTYVRWGDPWFWDKLRYALPHRLTSNSTPHFKGCAPSHPSHAGRHENIPEIAMVDTEHEFQHAHNIVA